MKKYRILPKEAIINFFMLVIILVLMLMLIENFMPQYGKWTKEDNFMGKDRRTKMLDIRSQKYPIIKLRRKEIINEENKKKILIIGDSFIEGNGYSNLNQTWWRQLELELYDRGYYDVEVYGAGISGASTYDEMNWLTTTKLIEDIKPDIIIIGYVANDPELDDENGKTIISHTIPVDYFSKNGCLKKIEQIFPNITYKINNMINHKVEIKGENKGKYNDETGYPYHMWYDVLINDYWSKKYDNLAVKPLGEYLNSIDIPFFLVTTPNKLNPNYKRWYKILSLFEKYNLKTYNMYSEFENTFKDNKDIYNEKINPVNGHPGTIFTKYYAEYISDIIQRDYPEVLGKKYEEKIEYPICVNDWIPYKLDLEVKEENVNSATYKIKIPDKENMLTMPINKEYIKLSFQYPIDIRKIELKGNTLKKAKLYVTKINEELGYDDQKMHLIGTEKGNDEKFELKGKELITSICISADMPEGSFLKIKIKK